VNEQSWTNLSSVLWVEQPVGTGFSQGTPNIQNEDDLSAQLVGFMQQFLEVFSELKGKKLYLTGESVSFPPSLLIYVLTRFSMREHTCLVGRTLLPLNLSKRPNEDIANYIYENPTLLDLSLQGIWISDRKLHSDTFVSSRGLIREISFTLVGRSARRDPCSGLREQICWPLLFQVGWFRLNLRLWSLTTLLAKLTWPI
jgi:hypothetical protein